MSSSADIDREPQVWFRCSMCGGYLSSIPELKKHGLKVHKVPPSKLKLPDNLPPGAKNGKIFYSPVITSLPKPFPYSQLTGAENQQVEDSEEGEEEDEESESSDGEDNGHTEKTQGKGEELRELEKEKQPEEDDEDCRIRLRKLSEILEVESSDEEESHNVDIPVNVTQCVSDQPSKNKDVNGLEDSPSAASPPDSGIMCHDVANDSHEDDLQQSASAASAAKDQSSTSKLPRKKKFACESCEKSYDIPSQLNFHVKKIHGKPKEKIVMTIRRNSANNAFTVANTSTNNTVENANCGQETSVCEGSVMSPARSTTSDMTTMLLPSAAATSTPTPASLLLPSAAATTTPTPAPLLPSASATTTPMPAPAQEVSNGNAIETVEIDSNSDSDSDSNDEITSAKKKTKRLAISSSKESESESEGSKKSDELTKKKKPRPRRSKISERKDGDACSSDEEVAVRKTRSSMRKASAAPGNDPPSLAPSDQKQSKRKRQESDSKSGSSSEDLFIPIDKKKKRKKKKVTVAVVKEEVEEVGGENEENKRISSTICRTCKMECQNTTALITHIEEVHQSNKKVTLICGYCKKRYTRKDRFNSHIQAHLDGKS